MNRKRTIVHGPALAALVVPGVQALVCAAALPLAPVLSDTVAVAGA